MAVVVQRYTHRFSECLAQIAARKLPVSSQLEAYAAPFESTYKRNRRICVCGMLGAEVEGLPLLVAEEVKRFFKKNIDWLVGAIREGQGNGTIENIGTPKSLAAMFLCSLEAAMVVGHGLAQDAGPHKIAATLIAAIVIAKLQR